MSVFPLLTAAPDIFTPISDLPLLSSTPVTWQQKLIYLAIVCVLCFLVVSISRFLVRRAMRKSQSRRLDTLMPLLNNVITYVVVFLALFTVLDNVFGVDATALLAAAGVLGVAIGFGAQTLVKDVITGFFLLLDDQFMVGETITLDGFTGKVESLGLRITRLRGESGDLFHIPNGSISKVINHSRGHG